MTGEDWKAALLSNPDNFLNVAKSLRMRNPEFRHTRFDIFSGHPDLFEILRSPGRQFQEPVPGSHPLITYVAEIENLKIQRFFMLRYFASDGVLTLSAQSNEFKVPKCFALILATPEVGTGDRSVDPTAGRILDRTKSLLFSLFGRQNITDYVGTLHVDSQTGIEFTESPGISNITIFESYNVGTYAEYQEISQRLNQQIGDQKNRISLAFSVFSRALFETDNYICFIYFWISLEVLGNTQNQGVVDILAKVYGVSRTTIISSTHVDELYKKRLSLFHKGVLDQFSPRLKRSFVCIFLDILRFEIGLPCKQHARLFFEWQSSIADPDPEKS